ncbi:MAG: HEAT repeat domain-containing protein [Planctomycetes bacterium]|nr:HEAT repeat domain-containing protein [Planctomycetota bacterium]
MRCKLACWIVCVWSGLTGVALAQGVPTPPAVPAVPTAPATPAQPANLWTFLCPPPGSCEKCKDKICKSFVGQYMGSMMSPMRAMTGMKPICPTANMPNPADLAKSAESPAGAAARIKQDEMEAKARRADVRFLGTVDCNRFPEAEKALIKALRTDRNECVRLEAALAMGNGCCCTRGTVEALMLTVTGSDKDGNPVETSPRVKHAATHALSMCQGRVQSPEPPERPVPLPEPKKLPESMQGKEVGTPRATPTSFGLAAPTPTAIEPMGSVPTGQRGLLQIFMRRVQPTEGQR